VFLRDLHEFKELPNSSAYDVRDNINILSSLLTTDLNCYHRYIIIMKCCSHIILIQQT